MSTLRLEGVCSVLEETLFMNAIQTAEHARALIDAYGENAEAHAAQKANALRNSGEHQHAEAWMQVRKAINQMRGSHVS
jgi:hypothetical protein